MWDSNAMLFDSNELLKFKIIRSIKGKTYLFSAKVDKLCFILFESCREKLCKMKDNLNDGLYY